MMKKLLCICFLLTLGNQLTFSQADYISWEFRGGNLLNNPDGTSTGPGPEPAGLFNTKIPTTNGRLPSAILADLDNDNDLDFISGSQEGSVHYFENTGTSTAPHWVLASIPTLDTIWIARDLTVRNQNRPQLADIDGDGDLDLFIGTDYDYEEDRNNDILFYRNISIDANSPIFEYVPAGLPGLNNQEIGEFPGLGFVDLDNDTDLDLVALGSDKLTYYKNIGTRTDPNFERQSEADSPWDDANAFNNMDAPIPVFEDFDKDGDYDMFFIVDDPGLVRWIENVGTVTTPNFVSPQKGFNGELTQGEIGSFGTIDFGDVDGDGLKDAILASFNVPRFAWFRQVPVCIAPTITEVAATPVLCEGETSAITISGNLNIASTWSIYTDSCGGTLIGITSTNISTFEVTITEPSTTFYIRGEDGDITCIDETTAICTSITIIVNDPSFNYSQSQYCVNEPNPTPLITGESGGTFNSTAGLSIDSTTGIIDIAASTPGLYTVTYTTAGTCPKSSDVQVDIQALDDASFSYDTTLYCINDSNPTPMITGLAGGIFSSTAGLNIDPNSGTIDIASSTTGSYTVTYTTAGTCPDSSEVTVEIVALDDPSFGYSQELYCSNEANPSPIITGTPGGTFSADAGLNIDPNSGTIDIASSTTGSYTVTYTTAGTCPDSSEITVEIVALDDPSFGYSEALYCINDPNPTPTITGSVGGTFSSTTGLSIDPVTGTIDIASSVQGVYSVTYTTIGTCPNSSNFEVDISALDDASFNYEVTTYCVNDSNPTPSITGLIGGVFSTTAGLSIDPSSGSIDIASSTPGIYTVTYTTSGTCPNSNTVDVTINELPDVIVINNSPTLTSTTLANASYQWINCDTNEPVSGETNASFTATENGLFAVEVTQNGCSIRSSCFAIQNLNPDDVDTINTFKTYPNPTRSSINLTLSTVNKITLYNYYGRKVFETSETSFDISSLTSGIYFMEVETNEGRTIKKIVRQ